MKSQIWDYSFKREQVIRSFCNSTTYNQNCKQCHSDCYKKNWNNILGWKNHLWKLKGTFELGLNLIILFFVYSDFNMKNQD